MDEARGERQKLEYPIEKFLKEKYPEWTVQDIQNSPMEQFVHTEWRAELRKRYPEIEEAYKNLPRVQNPALETLLVLLKLKFLRDQELTKLESFTMKGYPLPSQVQENFFYGKDISDVKDKEAFEKIINYYISKDRLRYIGEKISVLGTDRGVWILSLYEILETEKIVINYTGDFGAIKKHCERIFTLFDGVPTTLANMRKNEKNKTIQGRFNHKFVSEIKNELQAENILPH